jgi:small subunit ribosomal protein S2
MDEYIFGSRNGIHILDLTQTLTMLSTALDAIHKVVSKGGSILFVGTKRQAQFPISDSAQKCAQYYINYRWLGGTLTNWKTVSKSIVRLKELDQLGLEELDGYTKKERLNIEKEHGKLKLSLGGIRDMKSLPSMIFVVDTNKEAIAIKEAKKIGIPVVAVLDSNSSTDAINFPIPGNDDASRAISLYCELVSQTILDGMESQLGSAGIDIGEALEAPAETMPNTKEVDTSLEAKRVLVDSGVSDDQGEKASSITVEEGSVEEKQKVIEENKGNSTTAFQEQETTKLPEESNQNDSNK